LSAEEYPEISDVSDSEYFVIERKELKDMIVKTAFSVSQDDSRPMLKGVFFEISQGNASAVALDGYRLAKCVKSIEKTTALMTATVPQKCINEIAKLLDDTSDPATVFIHKNYLKVDLGHTEIISRLISEDFINYKQIIPSMFGTIVTLPAAQFESGLERAILLSRIEKNNLVRFDIKNDLLVLSSSSDIGNITEKIPVNLNGNDLSIAFNARYYTELLKFIGSENIVIKFTNAVSPCIVTPSGDSDDLLYLILPVRMVG
jgi:DNA polymerase-3 subunit beta